MATQAGRHFLFSFEGSELVWSSSTPYQLLLHTGYLMLDEPINASPQERGDDEGEEGERDCLVHARPPSRVIGTAPVIRETVPMAPDSKK
jgi:hypothetical protein